MSLEKPVRILNAEVARKIAAGEVIDRPNAIIRELMDNAIDSNADSITVEISGGGIDKVRVVDNGVGMTKDDLANCARPHATSKISTETDLMNLTTLGFRGEALASIAAVCRLSINSGGYVMNASITEDHIITPTTPLEGTIVSAEGLFENFPARRVFLKRPASEATLCKTMFVEKALANPQTAFRFINEGSIRLDLQKGQTLIQRFVKAMELSEPQSLFSLVHGQDTGHNPDWSFDVVIGEPSVHRPNKKDIFIFVNGRRIQEYSLVQAVEYGSQGFFPNGTFPVAAVFITVNPSLVDFNIHPAKREVRFKDSSSLHHGLSMGIKNHFCEYTNKAMKFDSHDLAEKAIQSEFENLSQRQSTEIYSIKDKKTNSSFDNFSSISLNQSTLHSSQKNQTSPWKEKTDWRESTKIGTKSHLWSTPENVICEHAQPIAVDHLLDSQSSSKKVEDFMDKVICAYNKKDEVVQPKTAENHESTSKPSIQWKDSQSAEDSKITDITMKAMDVFSANENPSSNWNVDSQFHFLGSALGTFLIAEKSGILYIIDKHAANERFLFDRIMENQGERQSLLIPYQIQTADEDQDHYMESIKNELDRIGFSCQNKGAGKWEISTVNLRWTGTQQELEHEILEKKINPKDIIYSIAAMTACKAAVKDGWKLEDADAAKIAEDALSLKDPHCPHGRPVYTCITREQLFELVRRT